MPANLKLRYAAEVIRAGGVIAYPTEQMFGLGCDPDCEAAIVRILDLKQRSRHAGFILIAENLAQLHDWISPTATEREQLLAPNRFTTWIVTANTSAPHWITGGRKTIAVRITQHPVAAALCHLSGTPLVSTSANRHGHPPARSVLSARCKFGRLIDCVVTGTTGVRGTPSEIRDARTGRVLRPG
jgi:L-threonylcarbamoyladenylate synthase